LTAELTEIFLTGSVFKILLFPDGDDLDKKDIMIDEEGRPVLSDPDPVPRCNLRAVPDPDNLMPQIRMFCKPLQGTFNVDAMVQRNPDELLLRSARLSDLVHTITDSVLCFFSPQLPCHRQVLS